MTSRRLITVLSGFLAVAAYLCFAAAAYAVYPGSYDPVGNWLSDLGNELLNPSGAFLYRFGCVLTGLLLVAMFRGLASLAAGQSRRVGIYLAIAQVLGALGGLALALSGIFSEGTHASHSFWSAVLFIAFGTAIFFVGLAFLFIRGFSRGLSYLAFIITACDWVMAAFNRTHFPEWIVVALLLVFVVALCVRLTHAWSRPSPRATLG